MPKVFLSYRRGDSIDVSGRIYDRLAGHFGSDSVFMDVDTIPLGVDFRTYLSQWVAKCDVLLAIVGSNWLGITDNDGNIRLGQPDDFVTIEIEAAIERKIPVIPVLVGEADMPRARDLPPVLSEFAFLNAAEVRSGRDFHSHMDRLIRGIERHFQAPAAAQRPTEAPSPPAAPVYVVVEPPSVVAPTNLDFAGPVIGGMPQGWFNSLGYVGGVSPNYDYEVTHRDTVVGGRCLRMHRTGAGGREFGSLMQRLPAHAFIGKRVRVEAEMRTEDVDSWAGLWLRVDGPDGHLFFENMHDRPIRGTTPWTKYRLEADVPRESEWLCYGVLLSGDGTLSVDHFKVHAAGKTSG